MSVEAKYAFFDGAGRAADAAALPLDSICLGRGIFESILVVDGRLVLAREHLDRLIASAGALGIADAAEAERIFEGARAFAADNPIARAKLRVTIFSGSAPRGAPRGAPGLAVGVATLDGARPAGGPQALAVSAFRRSRHDPLASHKTVNYLFNLVALDAARREGFDDCIILDDDGNVAETARANLFFEIDGRLVTPRLGAILPGVMRGWILANAAGLGVAVYEADVPASALASAGGAIATNSVVGMAPVARIDGRPLDDAREAEWFKRLDDAFNAVVHA